MLTVQQIKELVTQGKKVFWANPAYEVIKDEVGQYLIHCDLNDSYVGLTNRDEEFRAGEADKFYTVG